jgi:dynein heavy chain
VFDFILAYEPVVAWTHWVDAGIKDINDEFPRTMMPNEIVVPTIDTIRYTYLLFMLVENNIPMLFCGNTGTGKTIYIKDVIQNKLNKDVWVSTELGFSAQTRAGFVQQMIDGKFEVRKKRGIFIPAPDKKCLIFVDDLNMPEPEEFGAQPPIEILRTLLDHGGWFDLKDNSFRHLVGFSFVSAMMPPGDGR